MTGDPAIQELVLIARSLRKFHEGGAYGSAFNKVWRETVYHCWEMSHLPRWSFERIHSEKTAPLVSKSGKIFDRYRCTYEHAVPFSFLKDKFLTSKMEVLDIEIYLGHVFGVIVSREENETLRKACLERKMPEEWDGQDMFARYAAVGIKLIFPENWKRNYGIA